MEGVTEETGKIWHCTLARVNGIGDSLGRYAYSCDAANQMAAESTASTTRSYTWDVHGNQLSDGQAAYEYDGDGAMVARTQGGSTVRFYHDGMWVINEGDGLGAITSAMLRSGSDFLGRQVGSAPMAYFVHDAHGDVVGVVDGGGQFLAKYAYDAFGVLTGRSGSFDNPYLYAGEYYDYTTGQYYLRARFYTPAIGRFVTADTYRGELQDPRTLHLYAYVLSNPLSYIDPTGHRPILIDIGGPASEETIAEILMDYEKEVAGEFSSYVAASDLGLSKEAVEAAAEQVFDEEEEQKFARLRGQCVVGERELTAQFGDAGSRGFGCQLVMSYTFDEGIDPAAAVSVLGAIEVGVTVTRAVVVGTGVAYGAHVRQRMAEDPRAHGFPQLLDHLILSESPRLIRSDGRMEFLMKGHMGNIPGAYHITLNADGKTMLHRSFVPQRKWTEWSGKHDLPGWNDF